MLLTLIHTEMINIPFQNAKTVIYFIPNLVRYSGSTVIAQLNNTTELNDFLSVISLNL